jgi:hypothetical protein
MLFTDTKEGLVLVDLTVIVEASEGGGKVRVCVCMWWGKKSAGWNVKANISQARPFVTFDAKLAQ